MKRASHLVLAALVVLSFTLSALLVAGAVRVWGAPALRALACAGTRGLSPRLAHVRLLHAVAGNSCSLRPRLVAVANGFDVYSDSQDGQAYALVEPGADGDVMVEADGRSPDLRALTRTDRRPLLWFVRDGAEWVSRDPAVIARARAIVAPLRESGRQMGEAGRQMGARGAASGRLGARLGRLGARLAMLEARGAVEASDADERAQLRREADALRAEMDALSAQLREGDRGEGARLREQMRELSRRNEQATREARVKMRELIEDAVRQQKAERLGVGT